MNLVTGAFQQCKIALIARDINVTDPLSAAASEARGVTIEEMSLDEMMARSNRMTEFNAIILDVEDGALLDDERLLTARESWRTVPLYILSSGLEQQRARTVLRLQAADWLEKPIQPRELLNTVLAGSGSSHSAGKVVTFISASGGAGATFLTLQTAEALIGLRDGSADIAVLDLDFQKADIGGHINLLNEFDIDGIIADPSRIDPELLEAIQVRARPGVSIYSFRRPDVYVSDLGKHFVFNMLDNISYKHSLTLVDLPNRETPWFASVLKNSDLVVVVFELNIPSIGHAKAILQRIRAVRGGADPVVFLANKVRRSLFSGNIRYQEVQKVLGDKSVLTVGLAQDVVEEALDRSLFLAQVAGSSRLMKDIRKLVQEIADRIGSNA